MSSLAKYKILKVRVTCHHYAMCWTCLVQGPPELLRWPLLPVKSVRMRSPWLARSHWDHSPWRGSSRVRQCQGVSKL